MSKDTLPTNEQIAEYLDYDVPLQQLEQAADKPTFMDGQLAFAKSQYGMAGKRNKGQYKKNWQAAKGVMDDKR